MKKIFLSSILLLLSYSVNLFSQHTDDWKLFIGSDRLTKTVGTITYIIEPEWDIMERNRIIEKTQSYIKQTLELINEPEVTDSLCLILYREMNYFGDRIGGQFMPKVDGLPANIMMSVYGPQYNSIKHELTLLLTTLKWGVPKDTQLKWLQEGLAYYANPEVFNCDGYTFEERYVYFLQNDKLVNLDKLLSFSIEETMPYNKIAYNQCAYMVEYLISHYGIEKLKELWIGGMDRFEEVYGLKLGELIFNIHTDLTEKYPKAIEFDWKKFNTDCLAGQYEEWLPLSSDLYPGIGNMVSRVDGNFKYTVYSDMAIEERNWIIRKTKEYISQHLALIQETDFCDFAHIILCEDGKCVAENWGKESGMTVHKKDISLENRIYAFYSKQYSPLKHELMHLITHIEWGRQGGDLMWLSEGLATYADPTLVNCDGHTFEERYVYFLQTDRLLGVEALKLFFVSENRDNMPIIYNQSAYLVEYLIKNYGIEKIKELWINGLEDFNNIVGISFEEFILHINNDMKIKYPDPIYFNEEVFNKGCAE